MLTIWLPERMRLTTTERHCSRLAPACQHLGLQAAVLLLLDDGEGTLEDGAVVGVAQRGLAVAAAAREARGEVARLHQAHPYAEAPYLGRQGLTETLDGEFRGRVEPLVRQPHHTAYRAEVDNLAAARLAHVRQHGLAHIDAAHEVGSHLEVDFLLGGQLQGAADAHAGVVHQHIDATFLYNNLIDNGLYLTAVAHVAGEVFDGGVLHRAATEAVHRVPFAGQQFGRTFPKPRRRAGDDYYLAHILCFKFFAKIPNFPHPAKIFFASLKKVRIFALANRKNGLPKESAFSPIL